MKNEIFVRMKCYKLDKKSEDVLKILDKWGITSYFCDSDVYELVEEIVKSQKQEMTNASI